MRQVISYQSKDMLYREYLFKKKDELGNETIEPIVFASMQDAIEHLVEEGYSLSLIRFNRIWITPTNGNHALDDMWWDDEGKDQQVMSNFFETQDQ